VINRIAVGKSPSGMICDKEGKYLFISNRDDNTVEIYSQSDLSFVKKIKVGNHPYGLFVKKGLLFVVNVLDDSISIINTQSFATETIKVGDHPYGVVSDMNNQFAFVTNTQDDNISVIDLKASKEIRKIKVGGNPEGIDIDDKDNLLITSNWGSDSISIIDLAKQEYLYEIKTGKQSRSFGQFIKID
jgi:YVTN family beta-propeller protein